MAAGRDLRHELERTVEEATYLAVGLGVLAVREVRRRRRRAAAPPPPPPPTSAAGLVGELSDLAQPLVKELRGLAGAAGRFARDALRRDDDR
ncbi:MAG: hypothetical protein M0T71_04895 [Actinomycetota bacterium]|nr:hypothetical protein [Actinomycetota bacterium]